MKRIKPDYILRTLFSKYTKRTQTYATIHENVDNFMNKVLKTFIKIILKRIFLYYETEWFSINPFSGEIIYIIMIVGNLNKTLT